MAASVSDTARAFDQHAHAYDGIVEPNELLQTMRAALWSAVEERVAAPARLLDVGCGTGIDAEHFARIGYAMTAIDRSAEMVNLTRQRITRANPGQRLRIENLGAEEVGRLGGATFDAIYSDLGPLNCVADLQAVSKNCAAILKRGGYFVVSVMARICPWEIAYFTLRGDFAQAERRMSREMVPVKLENGIVWTWYYSPQEFFRLFQSEFRLIEYRALNLVLPPPYLLHWYRRAKGLRKLMCWLDARTLSLPLLRDMGDHFLMVLQKPESET